MKPKIFYNSKLAKAILFGDYNTMMFFGIIITKQSELSAKTINHESIHVKQFIEVTVTFAVVLGILSIFTTPWILTAFPFAYYIVYGLECAVSYVYHFFKGDAVDKINDEAYYASAFEMEAYAHENDMEYLDNRKLFAFIKYYGKI